MDTSTAARLCALTNKFYALHADSFSATRQNAWDGWQRCLEVMDPEPGPVPGKLFRTLGPSQQTLSAQTSPVPGKKFRALDLACGNLRFFSYLCNREAPGTSFELYAVDNCDELLAQGGITSACLPKVHYYNLDIMKTLLDGNSVSARLEVQNCDLVTCFGFMHHIPGHNTRRMFMCDLAAMCAPGAYIALSFWQFMNSAKLAAKARDVHALACAACGFEEAGFEEGDYLLGWQDLPVQDGNIRYAHSFSAAELEDLIESMAPYASCAARFEADGKTSNLNTYLIFKTK